MASICFYFQVHQPFRVRKYRFYDIGHEKEYFNDTSDSSLNNQYILERVSRKCYLPMNYLLLELLHKYPEFKASFSLSGVLLEQLELYQPIVLRTFQDLVKTGRVEILSETYNHSLAFLHSKTEFRRQVKLHKKIVKRLFNVTPKVFRNTELIYRNDVGQEVESMGYKGIIAEGADHILDWKSPNFLYQAQGTKKLALLVKNYQLSDDIAFRFSNRGWKEYPLTTEKFANWIHQVNGNGEVVNLFMDYETFGEHQWEDTGIFDFMRALPREILKHPHNDFVTPSEAIKRYQLRSELDFPHYVSWADVERDLSAWLSNAMQYDAMKRIYSLEDKVRSLKQKQIIDTWQKLQTSDHFYYMCTKWFADGDVHKYFNPYESPYEAFISYMNVMKDFEHRLENALALSKPIVI